MPKNSFEMKTPHHVLLLSIWVKGWSLKTQLWRPFPEQCFSANLSCLIDKQRQHIKCLDWKNTKQNWIGNAYLSLVLKWANRRRSTYLITIYKKIYIIPYQDSFQQEYRKLEIFYRLISSIAANDLYPVKNKKQNKAKK